MVCVSLNTRKAIARLTPAELHHPPRFGWYTRLDFILSSLYLAFFLSSRLCLNPRCRRDLNIAFMLHRVTRRCLLRKPSFFITWKFIARPLNRDEAKKNSSHNWSCGDRDDVWLSLPSCMKRVARFISEKIFFVRKRFWSSPRVREKKTREKFTAYGDPEVNKMLFIWQLKSPVKEIR